MMYAKRPTFSVFATLFTVAFIVGGCEQKSAPTPPAKTAATKTPSPASGEKPKEPLIKKKEIADWCPEHGVPESVCTRCNASLVEDFKKKGDWCKEHDLPGSQCLVCHPELKEKFEAMKPKGS